MKTLYQNDAVQVKEDGNANFYHVVSADGKQWVAVVQLNGEYMGAHQEEMMQRIADAFDSQLIAKRIYDPAK